MSGRCLLPVIHLVISATTLPLMTIQLVLYSLVELSMILQLHCIVSQHPPQGIRCLLELVASSLKALESKCMQLCMTSLRSCHQTQWAIYPLFFVMQSRLQCRGLLFLESLLWPWVWLSMLEALCCCRAKQSTCHWEVSVGPGAVSFSLLAFILLVDSVFVCRSRERTICQLCHQPLLTRRNTTHSWECSKHSIVQCPLYCSTQYSTTWPSVLVLY